MHRRGSRSPVLAICLLGLHFSFVDPLQFDQAMIVIAPFFVEFAPRAARVLGPVSGNASDRHVEHAEISS